MYTLELYKTDARLTRHGEAKVTGIELTKDGSKYGIGMDKIFVEDKDRCVFAQLDVLKRDYLGAV